ncbi:MAG TPA: MBL fold metallo-hydrolase [Candidatus Deferrimicrobium sp.]|nr:MBL fold metallo-hydrolase [Candidatus Deferrimicrobium sp.]
MTVDMPRRLRLTVLGCSTAVPHPASPASGYLVTWDTTSLLLDVGQGVASRLGGELDPRRLAGVIVGHMHADHYIDLAALRYLFPWGSPPESRLPVHLPPGGRDRLTALTTAISERAGFFDVAFDVAEYDDAVPLAVGSLTVRFQRRRHYVPAWAMSIQTPDGLRLVYTGDTGPDDEAVEFARGADLLLVEAALRSEADDDPVRGHLTADEAIDLARRAGAGIALIVHFDPGRQAEISALCDAAGPWIRPAHAGMTLSLVPTPGGERVLAP